MQPPAAVKRRRKRKTVQQLLPVVEERRPLLGDGVRVGLLGIGALAALAAAFFAGRKLLSAQLPKVQKVLAPPATRARLWLTTAFCCKCF